MDALVGRWLAPEELRAALPALDRAMDSPLVENDPPRHYRAPSHTSPVFDPATFPGVVDWAVGIARERQLEAIAGCGHSGLIAAGAIAYVLHIPVIAVRKYDDRAKGDTTSVNAIVPGRPFNYGLIDDFVASGETVERIVEQVGRMFPLARLTDVLLYRTQGDSPGHPDSWSFITAARDQLSARLGCEEARRLMIHGHPNGNAV